MKRERPRVDQGGTWLAGPSGPGGEGKFVSMRHRSGRLNRISVNAVTIFYATAYDGRGQSQSLNAA
jgi:hypothetical protein